MFHQFRFTRRCSALLTVLLLAACGGANENNSPPDAGSNPSALDGSSVKKALAAKDTAAVTWSTCAAEGQFCEFSGSQRVRYGMGDIWVEKVMNGTTRCDNQVFGDPVPGVKKLCQTQPIQWTFCSKEYSKCTPEGKQLVRFGAKDKWVIREVETVTACAYTVFGDPIPGTPKSCERAPLKGVSGPSDPVVVNAWSNPATWGGKVPPAGAEVVIPAGKTVLLDTKVKVKGLTVNGTLACGGDNIAIDADWVMVSGEKAKLSCGTQAKPYLGKFDLVLGGPKTDNINGMGARVLGAMSGAAIEMFGEPRTSWAKLGATTTSGSTTLTLAEVPKNWRAGMDIVIGSSSENPRHAEVRRIAAINGSTVTLASPLEFSHFGEQQTYANGKQSWTVDTRAPVGLLSRNITIQGGDDSSSTHFGGHMMSMASSKVYLSDVGFNRMGQKGLLGRYPFHWHFVGDATGQYVSNSTVWESYNRCFTIHGTDNALVENNVCYNHIGHGYFLEDGTEQGNTIAGNLGVLTVKPKEGEGILPSDTVVSAATAGPATFWVSNPQNTVRNNHANGSEGTGIWNFFEDRNMVRYDGQTINPRNLPFVEQADNTVSASEMGLVACEIKGGTQGVGGPGTKTVSRFTAFMTKRSGLWPCGVMQVFDDARLLDSGGPSFKAAFTAPQRMLVKNSLFVANSRLKDLNGGNKSRRAFGSYDQGSILQDSHFVGYTTQTKSALVGFAGGAVKDYTSRMQGLTFDPPQVAAFEKDAYDSNNMVTVFSVLNDVDGTLGAGGGMTLMPRSVFTDAMGCSNGRLEANTFGVLCPAKIVRARAQDILPQTGDVVMFMRRGGTDVVRKAFLGPNGDPNANNYVQFVAVANKDYHLGAEFSSDPGGNFYIQLLRVSPGDVIRYELRNVRPNTRVVNGDIAQVNSLQALESSSGSVWFRSGTTVHFKVVMPDRGEPWNETKRVVLRDN
jgi:G8 domain